MKKIIIYISFIFVTIIVASVIVVEALIVRIELPHGAVLHVLPAPKDKASYGAVILLPGGGYGKVSNSFEGYWWFPFYYCQGYTVAVLDYRLPNHNHQIPMVDGAEAVLMMRKRAEEWNYNKNNVGVMGFSAGGHLASTLMVSDNASARPDFGILFYPVISMKKEFAHKDSHDHLLGENVLEELESRYSNELHITVQTPPAYIALSKDDSVVKPQNSIRFYKEMCAKNRPVTFHMYPSGGHGWGYRFSFPYHRQMLYDLEAWLRSRRHADKSNKK